MGRNNEENRWVLFGKWVRAQRLANISPTTGRPMTIDEAASRADLSRVHWSRMEAGGTGTQYTTIPRIARALNRVSEAEVAEVYQRAGFAPRQESFDLPLSIRHYPELSEESKRAVAGLIERLWAAEHEASTTKKRAK